MKHDLAKKLRREQTQVERKLWLALRSRRFHKFKFRRQRPIGPYIADFVCFEAMVIIELDGDQHGSLRGLAYDALRTRRLANDGFRVLRFPNHDLISSFEGVLTGIAIALGLPS